MAADVDTVTERAQRAASPVVETALKAAAFRVTQ